MSRRKRLRLALALVLGLAAVVVVAGLIGRRATAHEVAPVQLGTPATSAVLEARLAEAEAEPGPLELQSVHAADWEVPLAGLLDLDHPTARAAGLEDRSEPITIDFHVLRHPVHGLFIVDTGVERAHVSDPEHALVGGLVKRAMNGDAIAVHVDTASWLAEQDEPLAGVFLTHLHLDHVLGLTDVPAGTPIYVGPGEADARAAMHFATAPIVDRALQGHDLRELSFTPDSGRFAGVLDVFGDGSLFAIHVPGHTPGSVAFVARTTEGPVLLTGDASHTRWGWDHGVGPGYFSADREVSGESLLRLRGLVDAYPQIEVRVGHQH